MLNIIDINEQDQKLYIQSDKQMDNHRDTNNIPGYKIDKEWGYSNMQHKQKHIIHMYLVLLQNCHIHRNHQDKQDNMSHSEDMPYQCHSKYRIYKQIPRCTLNRQPNRLNSSAYYYWNRILQDRASSSYSSTIRIQPHNSCSRYNQNIMCNLNDRGRNSGQYCW